MARGKSRYRQDLKNQWKMEKRGHIWPFATFVVFVAMGFVLGVTIGLSYKPSSKPSPMEPIVGGTVGFILWFIIWRVKRWQQKKAFYRKHGVD